VTFESFPDRECQKCSSMAGYTPPSPPREKNIGERAESSSTDAHLPDPGVAHLLRETHPTLRVESRVFPAYQTRGELVSATTDSSYTVLLATCASHLGCFC
jgi:hypothetical protein